MLDMFLPVEIKQGAKVYLINPFDNKFGFYAGLQRVSLLLLKNGKALRLMTEPRKTVGGISSKGVGIGRPNDNPYQQYLI